MSFNLSNPTRTFRPNEPERWKAVIPDGRWKVHLLAERTQRGDYRVAVYCDHPKQGGVSSTAKTMEEAQESAFRLARYLQHQLHQLS